MNNWREEIRDGSEKPLVLIVEDDPDINRLLSHAAESEGGRSLSAYSGTEALLLMDQYPVSLILLDLMIPGMDGRQVLEQVRKFSSVPVIVVSARSGIEEKVGLLKNGADDYITKPFDQAEIRARIAVQLRRRQDQLHVEELISYKGVEVNQNSREVRFRGHFLELTNSEYDILLLLLNRPGHAFSKSEIYAAIWKGPYLGDDNTISVHISNIRKKLATISREEIIKTVWGIGFMV